MSDDDVEQLKQYISDELQDQLAELETSLIERMKEALAEQMEELERRIRTPWPHGMPTVLVEREQLAIPGFEVEEIAR